MRLRRPRPEGSLAGHAHPPTPTLHPPGPAPGPPRTRQPETEGPPGAAAAADRARPAAARLLLGPPARPLRARARALNTSPDVTYRRLARLIAAGLLSHQRIFRAPSRAATRSPQAAWRSSARRCRARGSTFAPTTTTSASSSCGWERSRDSFGPVKRLWTERELRSRDERFGDLLRATPRHPHPGQRRARARPLPRPAASSAPTATASRSSSSSRSSPADGSSRSCSATAPTPACKTSSTSPTAPRSPTP